MEKYNNESIHVHIIKSRSHSKPYSLRHIGDAAEFLGMQDGKEIELYHAMNGSEDHKRLGMEL